MKASEIGLSDDQFSQLIGIFKLVKQVNQVKVFGSRAKGNYRKNSDIDLALFGDSLDRFVISKLLLELDDSNIPFKVDAQIYTEINNDPLKEHIDRVGIKIYP